MRLSELINEIEFTYNGIVISRVGSLPNKNVYYDLKTLLFANFPGSDETRLTRIQLSDLFKSLIDTFKTDPSFRHWFTVMIIDITYHCFFDVYPVKDVHRLFPIYISMLRSFIYRFVFFVRLSGEPTTTFINYPSTTRRQYNTLFVNYPKIVYGIDMGGEMKVHKDIYDRYMLPMLLKAEDRIHYRKRAVREIDLVTNLPPVLTKKIGKFTFGGSRRKSRRKSRKQKSRRKSRKRSRKRSRRKSRRRSRKRSRRRSRKRSRR